MNTDTTTATTPAFATPRLLVDNLHHVHDHGLSVEFVEPALVRWVDYLRSVLNGTLTFSAGKSRLTIHRNGNVTLTKFEPGRGYASTRLHYYCPATKIKTTILNGHPGFECLGLACFGFIPGSSAKIPFSLTEESGRGQDRFRSSLTTYDAWWVLGESGLRAYAANQSRTVERKQEVQVAQDRLADARHKLDVFRKRDFKAEVAYFHSQMKNAATLLKNRLKEMEQVRVSPEAVPNARFELGIRTLWDSSRKAGAAAVYGFPSVPEGWSHPLLTPNYTVTISEDGEHFLLSSKIKCPVSVKQALDWLRGEAPAPSTLYGEVKVVDARDAGNNPVRMVTCGCHRLDLRPLGGEFATLLAPKHKVKKIPGRGELFMGKASHRRAFYSELRRRIADRTRAVTREHDELRRDLLQERARIMREAKNKAAVEASLTAAVTEAETKLAEAKSRLDNALLGISGITLAQANSLGVAICNRLAGIPFTPAPSGTTR